MYARVGAPIVSNLIEGVSGAIIAYGCTGTGKTHTMIGASTLRVGAVVQCTRTRVSVNPRTNQLEPAKEHTRAQIIGQGDHGGYVVRFPDGSQEEIHYADIHASSLFYDDPRDEEAGLFPRIFQEVFARLDKVDHGEEGYLLYLDGEEVQVEVSFVQVKVETRRSYQREVLKDLLVPGNTGVTVRQKKSGKKNETSFATSAARKPAQSAQDCMALLHMGLQNRAAAAFGMTDESSRSHAIYSLHLTRTAALGESLRSTLYLADLAGNETLITRGTNKNWARKMQDMAIGKSLTALGQVVSALAKISQNSSKTVHIPFRGSMLTKLLHGALMGGAQSAIVATCSPSELPETMRETLETLKFAEKANKVRIRPRRTVVTSRATLSLAMFKLSKLERRYEDARKVAIDIRLLMRRVVQQIAQELSIAEHVAALQFFPCLSTDISEWDAAVWRVLLCAMASLQ